MTTSKRSRRWLPGGGSRHPFLYRTSEVIDLRAVDDLVESVRQVIDLVAEERTEPARPRRVADPFTIARR